MSGLRSALDEIASRDFDSMPDAELEEGLAVLEVCLEESG